MKPGGPSDGFGTGDRRTWYWIAGALVSYLLAGVLLVIVFVSALDPERGFSVAALTGTHIVLLGVGTALFAVGGYCARKAKGQIDVQHEEQVLPQEFHVLQPPNERGEGGDEGPEEGPITAEEAARNAEIVTCPECGTENDRGFTYCENCAAELPE